MFLKRLTREHSLLSFRGDAQNSSAYPAISLSHTKKGLPLQSQHFDPRRRYRLSLTVLATQPGQRDIPLQPSTQITRTVLDSVLQPSTHSTQGSITVHRTKRGYLR